MKIQPEAVIFDMDGVLIDSEHLWRKAMIIGFNRIGLNFTEEDCRKTTGMRFREVVKKWLDHYSLNNIAVESVERDVLSLLIEMIRTEGKPIAGALDLLEHCRRSGLLCGVATSSYSVLVNAVLEKLNLEGKFHSVVSAENMKYGKPHPEVFLKCAEELKVLPSACMVIEDSINGVIAGKAAGMMVITVPDVDHKFNKQFAVADHQCENMHEVLKLFKELKLQALS